MLLKLKNSFVNKNDNYFLYFFIKLISEFLYGGNDERYPFITKNEFWIDGQISFEETEFSITCELAERKFMSEGISYCDA